MPTVRVDGEEIFYADRGRGAPVVFLHGAGGNHRNWLKQVQGLEDSRRIAVDLPGHGRSAGSGRASIEEYAGFVLDLARALRLESFVAAGHSMGGAVALQLALDNASRLRGLVLADTGARLRVLPGFLDGIRDAVASAIRMWAEWSFSGRASATLIQEAIRDFSDVDPRVFHRDLLACDGFDVMDRLAEIGLPTLVICGAEDRLTPPKYAQYLTDHIPGAELVVIPDAGHMVMREAAEEVTQAIAGFLALLLEDPQGRFESPASPGRGG